MLKFNVYKYMLAPVIDRDSRCRKRDFNVRVKLLLASNILSLMITSVTP